eukprot:1169656-Amphidinium_carterae.2
MKLVSVKMEAGIRFGNGHAGKNIAISLTLWAMRISAELWNTICAVRANHKKTMPEVKRHFPIQ